jgi:hypothetical protein
VDLATVSVNWVARLHNAGGHITRTEPSGTFGFSFTQRRNPHWLSSTAFLSYSESLIQKRQYQSRFQPTSFIAVRIIYIPGIRTPESASIEFHAGRIAGWKPAETVFLVSHAYGGILRLSRCRALFSEFPRIDGRQSEVPRKLRR